MKKIVLTLSSFRIIFFVLTLSYFSYLLFFRIYIIIIVYLLFLLLVMLRVSNSKTIQYFSKSLLLKPL